MGRKRIDLGHDAEGQIRALMARGGTVESITAALTEGGVAGVSKATVARRMAEMRQGVNAGVAARREERAGTAAPAAVSPPPASEPALPASLDDIPEGTGLDTYDRWLERAERMAVDAEIEGDLKAIGNAGRLVGLLLEAKRKATPIPKSDPNDNVDMVKLGAEVAERLHKMVDPVR